MVLPVLHALQGHPEFGALWEHHVLAVLQSLDFKTTTHECCLYHGFHEGKLIFICCQVGNFKVAGPDGDIIQDLINAIGGKIQLTVEKELIHYYNGIDYKQTQDYVKMHAKTYLSKILKNHDWECGTKEEDKIIKPIHPDLIKELETTVGPSSEAESKQLEAEEEIGYAVAKISKFSASPAHCHYKEIKQGPRDDLPEGTHIQKALSDTDQKFIGPEKADQLAIY
eukprot:15332116-Ditylum_brightwellii.AAC.1